MSSTRGASFEHVFGTQVTIDLADADLTIVHNGQVLLINRIGRPEQAWRVVR